MIKGAMMACILCGHETSRIIHPKRGVYHLCPNCELITEDPAFHPSEEEAFKEYSLHENSSSDPRYIAYFRNFLESAVFPLLQRGRTPLISAVGLPLSWQPCYKTPMGIKQIAMTCFSPLRRSTPIRNMTSSPALRLLSTSLTPCLYSSF